MEIAGKAGPSGLPPSEDTVQVLRSIDALESRLCSMFSDIEQQLEDCERTSIQAIHKTIEDIRVENEESMEAVQLDLELLRQKVKNRSLVLDSVQILQPELTEAIIACKISLNPSKLTTFLLENIERTIKLPSTSLHLLESEDERVLFALSARGEEGIPFATALQNAHVTESSDSRRETEGEIERETEQETGEREGETEEEEAPPEEEKQGRVGRLLAVTVCMVAVGVATRFIVSRLVQR